MKTVNYTYIRKINTVKFYIRKSDSEEIYNIKIPER